MLIEGHDKNNVSTHVEVKKGQMAVTTASPINKATVRGDAYNWNAVSAAGVGATDCLLMVRNLSPTRLLVINRIYVWADVSTALDVHLIISSATFGAGAAQVAVVGVNLNTSSNKVPDADAHSDDDNVGQGDIICTLMTNETSTTQFAINFPTNDAIVLGTNGCIGVDAVADVAAFECTITGYFIDR